MVDKLKVKPDIKNKDLVKDINELKNNGIETVAIMSNDTKNYPEDSFVNMLSFSKINRFNF